MVFPAYPLFSEYFRIFIPVFFKKPLSYFIRHIPRTCISVFFLYFIHLIFSSAFCYYKMTNYRTYWSSKIFLKLVYQPHQSGQTQPSRREDLYQLTSTMIVTMCCVLLKCPKRIECCKCRNIKQTNQVFMPEKQHSQYS